MSLNLPGDFAVKIAETFNWKLAGVQEWFEFSEDKQGYFWATLKPKKFLDKPDFQALCRLTRDLGGEDYLKGARAWKVPGALAKKDPMSSQEKPSEHGIDSEPAYKEPRKPILTSPYTLLPIKALYSMPFQSRVTVEGPDFEDLVESIRTVGILHPILVREKTSGLYEIVAGERRAAAAKKAGLFEVPANVKALTDQEAYEIQLVENIQRKDLSDMEKARMLDMMIKKFSYTQEALGKKVGKSQGWVSQHVAMLQIPDTITRVITHGELTEHQGREILAAPEEKREEILDKINETGKVPTSREIHEIAHPTERPQILFGPVVNCARCGEPIHGTPVHLGAGKYYDAECAEQEAEESKKGLIKEEHVGPFEEAKVQVHFLNFKEKPVLPKPSEPEMHVSEGTSIDVADFTCPQCHQSFRIVHLPNGKHKFSPVREA